MQKEYYQEQWLSMRYPEVNRQAYIETIRDFNKGVKMVAGEANGKIFDQEEFFSVLREGLRENPEAQVSLVFHKEGDIDKARLAFEQDNPHLTNLKRQFPDKVHLWWAPKRPSQHYAVVDDNRVLFEQPNHRRGKPWWGNIVMDSSIAKEWERRFDKYVGYCSELLY